MAWSATNEVIFGLLEIGESLDKILQKLNFNDEVKPGDVFYAIKLP